MRVHREVSAKAPPAAPDARQESESQRIRRDHADLRGQLEEIELLLARWEAGVDAAGAVLRDRGLALYERLDSHIEIEEGILAPILFASEDGERRALQLAAEHREQRDLLAYLRPRMSALRPTVLVARELRNFLAYLREDMAREEGMLEALGAGR
jgi:hemerythrin-like domain-containing protein